MIYVFETRNKYENYINCNIVETKALLYNLGNLRLCLDFQNIHSKELHCKNEVTVTTLT